MSIPADYWLKQIRAELASTKARLCGHGVDRSRGKCHECEPQDHRPDQPQPQPEPEETSE